MKQQLSLLLGTLALILFVGGCSKKASLDIADVRKFSQDPADYIKSKEPDVNGTRLTAATIQNEFDGRYFAPWSLKAPPYQVEDVKWPWRSYTPNETFGANQRPLPESWYKLMLLEANFASYGKISAPGIIIKTTHIRNFPSAKPVFKSFAQAGEGYPFDYSQNSVTTANEPVLISHYSKTKEWAYIISSYTSGWVASQDVALVGGDIIKKWSQARQTLLLEDDMPLYDLENNFITNSRIGMMLPIMKVEDDSFQGILANSKSGGFVTFAIVRIPKASSISESLPMNSQSIAIMAKSMMNKEYGWGGIFFNRDCSSTLRDLFKPFSMWLPRNSKEQAQVGRIYDLSLLKPKQKRKEIIKYALPFQTLLYKPGHIMLYLGTQDDKIMVMHNVWGIMTKNKGLKGRFIVGRTVITTLEAGKEVSGFVKKNTLLNRITSMNIISMEPTATPIVIEPKKGSSKKKKKSRRSRKDKKESAKKESAKKDAEAKSVKSSKPKKRMSRSERRAARKAERAAARKAKEEAEAAEEAAAK